MSHPEKILATLRDVAGVEGSWLLGEGNAVVGRDLSALYPDEIISALGSRLRQISEAATEHLAGRDEDLFMRFEGRSLFVRRAGSLLLAVMTLPAVNYQSLRIGAHLVLRQLTAPPANPPAMTTISGLSAARPASPVRPAAQPTRRPAPPAAPPKKNTGIWGD